MGYWNPFDFIGAWKHNLQNGYQFGDAFLSQMGYQRDDLESAGYGYHTEHGDVFPSIGGILNDITGTTATNNMNSALAAENRAFQHQERLETQDYNSAEAVANWERSEESAQRARDFTAQMDNTALQRRIADAEAAGLNPMMLVGGSGLSAGFQGSTAGNSSAAQVSSMSGSAATASGNSAAAVGGMILALAQLLKVAKGKPVTNWLYGGE